MVHKSLFILLFFYLVLVPKVNSQERFGQSENFNNLLQSIKSLSLHDKDGFNYNLSEKRNEIDAKLNYAQTYLIIELANLTLSDSSDYYEKKLKELKELEGKKLKGKDSIMLLNEKEKLYLFTSILKPSRCDTNLVMLMQIWYGIKLPAKFHRLEECTINYKIWLYELSENRFAKEKEAKYFTKRKELMYLRKARFYSDLPYNNITNEKVNMSKEDHLISLSKNDSLKYDFYKRRALRLSASNLKTKTDTLTDFIEQLWLKAYESKPNDYSINYNLFVFYYNTGATLMRSIEYGISEKELNNIQEQVKKIFQKALYYAEKIGLADKYRDKLKVD